MDKIKGNIWLFGDNVDTDQILPGYAMTEPVENLHTFAMAGSQTPDFAKLVQAGDMIVAQENFGSGSSREQAPVALKNAGVSLVIAQSFARIFRRNAINIGLPVIEATLVGKVKQGEVLMVSLKEGTITQNGVQVATFHLTKSTYETIKAGGLINRVRSQLQEKEERERLITT